MPQNCSSYFLPLLKPSSPLNPFLATDLPPFQGYIVSLQLSRCSKLVYTIHAGISQFNIALPHSFAPTTVFHQSRSPLRSFFKTAVGTK